MAREGLVVCRLTWPFDMLRDNYLRANVAAFFTAAQYIPGTCNLEDGYSSKCVLVHVVNLNRPCFNAWIKLTSPFGIAVVRLCTFS